MSTQETRETTVDFWILDPSVKLKSKNVNTKYCEKLTKSNSSMHCFVNSNPVLFFQPNLKQPKIEIIIDAAKNVTTENLVENYKN